MISDQLYFLDTPPLRTKMLHQNTDVYTFSMTMIMGKVIKRDYVVIVANMFLHSAVVSLDFWDVFISRRDVKLSVQVCKVATH